MPISARLPWELLGAVIGAGLASGREVASFFSRYGAWSWIAVAAAMAVLAWLGAADVPSGGLGRLWRILQALLLTATGGAMLAGAGEVAALTLPVHGAYFIGIAGTLALSCFLARRTISGLAWVSRGLLAVLGILIALGLTRPPMHAVLVEDFYVSEAILRGVTYGGFNAALQAPIMTLYRDVPSRDRKRAVGIACLLLTGLLCLCNAVLLRHPALIGENMPFVRLMAGYGPVGCGMGSFALYLAILSTLTACLKGLGGGIWPVIGICAAAMLGFSGAVDVLYPLLGGGCFLTLLAAKFRNSSGNTFISRRSML